MSAGAARPRRGCRAGRCGRWRARTATRSGPGRRGRAAVSRSAHGSARKGVGARSQQLGQVVDHDVGAVLPAAPRPARRGRRRRRSRSRRRGRPRRRRARPRTPPPRRARRRAALGRLRKVSGAGLPAQALAPRRLRRRRSASNRSRDPGGLEHLAGSSRSTRRPRVRRPASRAASHVADRPRVGLDALVVDDLQHELVLAVAQAVDGLRRASSGAPSGSSMPREARNDVHAVVARLAVDVLVVVVAGVKGMKSSPSRSAQVRRRTSASRPARAPWRSRSGRRRGRTGRRGSRRGAPARARPYLPLP